MYHGMGGPRKTNRLFKFELTITDVKTPLVSLGLRWE
jgi:hypothetical protein